MRPMRFPTRLLLTVVIMSTSIHDLCCSGSVSEGSISNLTSGASTLAVEIGQTTTVLASAKKSDCTITAGRGLLVNCPFLSAIDTTSPRNIVALLVAFVENADGLHPFDSPVRLLCCIDFPALSTGLLRETRGTSVRNPNLDWTHSALAECVPVPLDAGAGRGLCHALHVTSRLASVNVCPAVIKKPPFATACSHHVRPGGCTLALAVTAVEVSPKQVHPAGLKLGQHIRLAVTRTAGVTDLVIGTCPFYSMIQGR